LALKNKIKKLILFFIVFFVLTVISFEIVFRFFSADSVIYFLGNLSIFGFGQSVESLIVLLVLLSFFATLFLFLVVLYFIKKRKVG